MKKSFVLVVCLLVGNLSFSQKKLRFDDLKITNIRESKNLEEVNDYCGCKNLIALAITIKNESGTSLNITDLEIDAIRKIGLPIKNLAPPEVIIPGDRAKGINIWWAKIPNHPDNYTYTYHPERKDTICKNKESITIHIVLTDQDKAQLPEREILTLRFKTDKSRVNAQSKAFYFKEGTLVFKK